MAKILITGHKGFIGTHLYKALQTDHEVVGMDIYGYDPAPLDSYDGIIHLAAISRVKHGEADPVRCMQTNIIETAKMLELKHQWFILASTNELPNNVYGLSKKCAEEYVRLKSVHHIILRFSNVYGIGMAEDKMLPALLRGDMEAHDGLLPFEHIHVKDLCDQIKIAIRNFERPAFKSYTMKLATGVAKTVQELADVATSY